MKKYALFIGRWQTWHSGHEWLIRQQLDNGKNCWVAIRDVQVDENKDMKLFTTTHQLILNQLVVLLLDRDIWIQMEI